MSDLNTSTGDESHLSSFWESSDHDTTSLFRYSSQSDSDILSECSEWEENGLGTESGEDGGKKALI